MLVLQGFDRIRTNKSCRDAFIKNRLKSTCSVSERDQKIRPTARGFTPLQQVFQIIEGKFKSLFPFDGGGGFGGNVVDHSVYTFDRIYYVVRYFLQNFIRELSPICGHSIHGGDRP